MEQRVLYTQSSIYSLQLRINNPLPVPLQNNEIKSYGLLSIDGGGSRGIIAAKIMEILETKIGKPLWTLFDLAGGTSAGGLLVLSSMKLHTPAAELTRVFSQLSSKIFPFSRPSPTIEYSHETLKQELNKHFGEVRLTATKSLPKLFVVTKRSTDTQPYLLRNYVTSAENNLFYHGCSEWLCSDAARATSAAPTYFTAFDKDGKSYTDGGIGFNNPVHLVFEEALAVSTDNALSAERAQTLYHLPIPYIVSIGTGLMPSLTYAPSSVPIWGSFKRVIHPADLLVEQATECENSHREMEKKCQRYNIPYFRFNTPLQERVELDISNENDLNKLIELTDQYMNSERVLGDIQKLRKLIEEK
jgi:patatin-like phospholipase/acyl hydrolase